MDHVECYSVCFDLLIRKLPAADQLATLLTVSPPKAGRQRPTATLSINSQGHLVPFGEAKDSVIEGADGEQDNDTRASCGATCKECYMSIRGPYYKKLQGGPAGGKGGQNAGKGVNTAKTDKGGGKGRGKGGPFSPSGPSFSSFGEFGAPPAPSRGGKGRSSFGETPGSTGKGKGGSSFGKSGGRAGKGSSKSQQGAANQVKQDTGAYCTACYEKLAEPEKPEHALVEPPSSTTRLASMGDWGTPHCINLHRLRLVRNIAAEAKTDGAVPGEQPASLSGNMWHSVCVLVNAELGQLQAYIDGVLALDVEGLQTEDLLLQPKIRLFGGGLEAHNRGGDARRLVIYNRVLTPTEIQGTALQSDLDLLQDAAPKYEPPEGDSKEAGGDSDDSDPFSFGGRGRGSPFGGGCTLPIVCACIDL